MHTAALTHGHAWDLIMLPVQPYRHCGTTCAQKNSPITVLSHKVSQKHSPQFKPIT